MKYHAFCVEQIYNALSLGLGERQYNSISFKYALKNGLLGLYAETYYLQDDDKEMKFFDVDFASKKYKGKQIWKNILCSKNAYQLCKDIESGEPDDVNKNRSKTNRNVPFYEHIEPKSITYNSVIALAGEKISSEADLKREIKRILDRSKIVILTYSEKEYLDKKGECFTPEDENLIREWVPEYITAEVANETIESMKRAGKYLRCNNYGNGLARIAHLKNSGADFIWEDMKNEDEIKQITEYLNSDNHIAKNIW